VAGKVDEARRDFADQLLKRAEIAIELAKTGELA
jgi:hypothetical protein